MKRILLCTLLTGCNLVERLSSVGDPPVLTPIQNPTQLSHYQPVSMPNPPVNLRKKTPNSLWETGSKAFFKDQRAAKTGDIITVLANIDQSESIQMNPKIDRTYKGDMTVGKFFGLENTIKNLLPKSKGVDPNPSKWIDVNNNPSLSGSAQYDVKDKINVTIAAMVIQTLPNGNMVIQGRQEIRLVNEVREIQLAGIIRREDVSSSNTVGSDKIAELRISYGGRGDLSDAQNIPWGQQVLNKVMPF